MNTNPDAHKAWRSDGSFLPFRSEVAPLSLGALWASLPFVPLGDRHTGRHHT